MSLNKPKQLLAMDALNQENRSKVTGALLPIVVSTLAAMSIAFWLNVGNHTASVSRGLAPWEEFYSVFGMIYAIVSGFLLVEVLNRFNKLSEVVEAELNAISDVRDFLLYVDGQEDIKLSVKKELQEYVHSVATVEWSTMNDDYAVLNSDTSKELYDVMHAVNKVNVNNESDREALHFLISEMSSITSLRTERISIANQQLPPRLKHLLIYMSVVLVAAFIINAGIEPWIHCFMVGSITACVHLLYIVIADLNTPFTGLWTISVSPLIELYLTFDETQLSEREELIEKIRSHHDL
jgi:ABC-type multidrug transport system fused ATPase/permease subunit